MEKPLREYPHIGENLRRIRAAIEEAALSAGRDPAAVSLMAVTKTVPAEAVNAAIAGGVTLLGENRAQELCEKYDHYARDKVSIHFIGHLQTNKVRQIADKVDMVHSLDRLSLAKELNRQAAALGKSMDVLVEVNVGGESSKSGLLPADVLGFCDELAAFESLRLRGLMTIPPVCDNIAQTEQYFSQMEGLFIDIQAKNMDNRNVTILSMGMSEDFPIAIRHGATIVRIGTALFGDRQYSTGQTPANRQTGERGQAHSRT
ncbi:YggS family pyridoxal phosphate-dependent enzyme [Ruminococcaceae bacterium OttesenSCG-928-L11]|nr:YggS family pyridoxal phosphate-dependent enzyme [Ruminococcaceae bacterium OttesenSCG-928-L11]